MVNRGNWRLWTLVTLSSILWTLRMFCKRSRWWIRPARWARRPWQHSRYLGTRVLVLDRYFISGTCNELLNLPRTYFFWKPTMSLTFGAEVRIHQTFLDQQAYISTPGMLTLLRSRWTDAPNRYATASPKLRPVWRERSLSGRGVQEWLNNTL